MTNIAKILENAPRGLKLYSLINGNVTLVNADTDENITYQIQVKDLYDNDIYFNKNGFYFNDYDDAKCILFPSKEHKSWDNWQEVLFKQGDYIICEVVNISEDQQNVCCIYNGYNKHYNDYAGYFYCHESITTENLNKQILLKNARYATPEEREQFFKELNNNGYYWNENTKQMENSLQNTPKQDYLGCVYTKTKEEPFTIDDFKPFDKVLVTNYGNNKWVIDLFGYYDYDDKAYFVAGGARRQCCIPYNDETKHLLGTTDDCPDKYKTW